MGWFIKPVRGESVAVARDWRGPVLDVVFIDGDHSLEGCYADLCAWGGRLKPGGQLLGHDAEPGSEVEAAGGTLLRGARSDRQCLPVAVQSLHLEGMSHRRPGFRGPWASGYRKVESENQFPPFRHTNKSPWCGAK